MLFDHFCWTPYSELYHFKEYTITSDSSNSPTHFYRWILYMFGDFHDIDFCISIDEVCVNPKVGHLLQVVNNATKLQQQKYLDQSLLQSLKIDWYLLICLPVDSIFENYIFMYNGVIYRSN